MPDRPDSPPPTDRAAKQAEQRRLVRSGCATALGLLALVAVPILGYVLFARFLASATLGKAGPDLLVLYPTDRHADAIVWLLPVTLIAAFGLMALAKTWAGLWLRGLLALAAGSGIIYSWCYTSFVAIRTLGDRSVELVYLWPRPDVRLDPRGAVVTLETVLDTTANPAALMDCIVVERDGSSHRSALTNRGQQVQALLVSRGATPGTPRRSC